MTSEDVLKFWFEELEPKQWFTADAKLDEAIRERFGDTLAQAKAGELDVWAETPQWRLALIIVLDQFSRNLHRDIPEMYAADVKALALTREGIGKGMDAELETPQEKHFFYMPLMHAESKEAHEENVAQFLKLKEEGYDVMEYPEHHKGIIDRFGRFPHRNELLGRESTEEEKEFLAP